MPAAEAENIEATHAEAAEAVAKSTVIPVTATVKLKHRKEIFVMSAPGLLFLRLKDKLESWWNSHPDADEMDIDTVIELYEEAKEENENSINYTDRYKS